MYLKGDMWTSILEFAFKLLNIFLSRDNGEKKEEKKLAQKERETHIKKEKEVATQDEEEKLVAKVAAGGEGSKDALNEIRKRLGK